MNYNNSVTTLLDGNAVSSTIFNDVFQLVSDTVHDADKESAEKYKIKERLIEEAADMSTQEKLDAMDRNYDRRNGECWKNIIISVQVLCIAAALVKGGPKVFKNIQKRIAA